VSQNTQQPPASGTGTPGPRTKRGSRSRDAIRVAARRAFRDVGYAGARVSDIAEDAGLSNGAFYRYFADKEAVMLSLVEELLENAIEFAHAPWEEDKPAESIYLTTERYLNFYSHNADLFRVLVEASQVNPAVEEIWAKARNQVIARVARMLAKAKAVGVARDDVDTQMAAILLVSMTDHYAYLRFILGRVPARSISRASREISTLWANGAFVP
jgi:AcrR family transcriptional regulator